MALLLALLLPLDLAIPTQLGGPLRRDLAGAERGLALRVLAPESTPAEAREISVELIHTNVGEVPIALVRDDCDSATHFLQLDGVEYPLRVPQLGCRKRTEPLAPGASFSTFVRVALTRDPHWDLDQGPTAGCGRHRVAASYRTNAFLRADDTWAGALDALPFEIAVDCP